MCTEVVEMNQAQLINSIEQQLENLMHFDGDLADDFELMLYDDQEQPILKNFTPQVLEQLTQIVYELDND
jgi:hypothetical protein